MLAGTPVLLLREGTQRAEGRDAERENLRAARAVAESIRSTLGPRGMDKMLVAGSGEVVITNDGATILREMEVEHPAARMLAEVARTQDQECGDGTKTSVIFAGELLKQADALLDERVHPTIVVRGYQLAEARAVERIGAVARPVGRRDTALLTAIAMTAMISKGVAGHRERLAELAVRAVDAVVEGSGERLRFDRKNIQFVRRPGGDVLDSELLEGHVLEQQRVLPAMPSVVAPARIALVEGALEVPKTEIGAEIRITDPAQLEGFRSEEERLLTRMAEAVAAAGANVLITEKGIDDLAAETLARRGIFAVRRAKRSELDLLAKATGGRLVARPQDLARGDLGTAARVEERKVGDDRLTFVTGCPHARSVSLLLRGGSEHVVEEVERSLVDAVSTVGLALEDGRVVTGAGAAATEASLALRDYAMQLGGREQIAVEAFAHALEVIPLTLAENAGMDTLRALVELRRRHRSGEVDAGVDVLNARVANMAEVAVEPIRVGVQAIHGATEAAVMLLRIDDVVAARRSAPAAPGREPGARLR